MTSKSLKGIHLLRLIPLVLSLVFMSFPYTSEAQTKVQKGVARKITKSANETITPVPGVQVTVGSVTSPKSDNNGKFSVKIAQSIDGSYLLSRVRMPEETDYELVLPHLSKKQYISPNDLEIIVISKKEKDEDFKEKYRILKKKYNDTSKQLIAVREELEDKKLDYDTQSKEYAALNQQLDSVQNLIDQYFNESNREQVTQLLRSVAEEMALTDYQSLDSLQRKIYDLKCEGDWQTISELILKSMNGNCAVFLKEGKELADAASTLARTAQEEFERRCNLAEQQIEAYRMLHKNDSVSHYYDILIEVNPTNWEYITESATFEDEFRGNLYKALELNQKAYTVADTDSLRARSLHNIGVIYASHGYHKEALDYANRSLELRESIYGKDNKELVKSFELLSVIYSGLDQPEKADEMLDNAFEILSNYIEVPETVTLLNNKGTILSQMDRREEALQAYERAISLINDYTDDDSLLTKAILLDHLGVVKSHLSQYSEAYDAHIESLNIQIPILGEQHPSVAQNLLNLGTLFNAVSQYGPAKEYTQNALDIYKDIYGEKSSATAMAYNNLGHIVVKENPQKGIELYKKALEINENLYGRSHSSVALVLNNLASAYFEMGRIEEGTDMLMESIDIYKELYGEYSSDIAIGYNNFATVLKRAQEYEKALEFYLKALEISRNTYGENSFYTAAIYNNIGSLYDVLNEYDKSLDYYQKALNIREAIYGPEHYDVAMSYSNLANIYLSLGDTEKAKEYFEKSLSINKALYGEESLQYMTSLLNYAYLLATVQDFGNAKELGTKVTNFYIENLGELNPTTQNALGFLSYAMFHEAVANNTEQEFYSSHLPVTYVMPGGEASKRGLDGKYRLIGFNDWNLTKLESFEPYLQNASNQLSFLFYRDGKIISETFDGKAGVQTMWAPIDPQEREEILNCYQKWLQDAE